MFTQGTICCFFLHGDEEKIIMKFQFSIFLKTNKTLKLNRYALFYYFIVNRLFILLFHFIKQTFLKDFNIISINHHLFLCLMYKCRK